MDKVAQLETIEKLAKPVVESLGYRLIEREFAMEAGRLILRIYIDREGGVTLEDCSTVSRNLSAQLDVEDPVPGKYDLEVSSPGIERPLRYLEDFKRHTGETIKLRTKEPINNRQNYRGTLTNADAQNIYMTIDGTEFTIPFSALLKARIIKEWNPPQK
jgi:ribosome maturation factor RimP